MSAPSKREVEKAQLQAARSRSTAVKSLALQTQLPVPFASRCRFMSLLKVDLWAHLHPSNARC